MKKVVNINRPTKPFKQTNAMSSFYNKTISITYGEIESNNTDGTTNVLLNNGFICEKIKIQSTNYPSKDPLVGGIKYPPIGSQVIVLHPENDINSGFIQPAPLDYRDESVKSEILGQGDKELIEGGWIKTFDPKLGILTFTHKDYENLTFSINPNTKIIDLVDFNGNKFSLHEKGISVEDLNGNSSVMNDKGITVTDLTGNSWTFSATGTSIKDTNGNEITQGATGTSIKTGDSTIWMPNILPNCLFTGAPHGGSVGGISKLTGG